MARRPRRPVYVSGLIERSDDHVMITCSDPSDALQRRWGFPCGLVSGGDSPEAALRALTRKSFGLDVEVMVGQPPILSTVEGEEVELRFFFCGMVEEFDVPAGAPEVRWIPKPHLLEYDFDDMSQPVVDWLCSNGKA